MLVSALGATLVGFALLVLALATGTLWLAVACIVICVLGALLLLADTLGIRPSFPRRSSKAGSRTDGATTTPDGPAEDDDAPTEQFARVTDEPVMTLADDQPAVDASEDAGAQSDRADETIPDETPPAAFRHGRHERPGRHEQPGDDEAADESDAADAATSDPSTRRGRHGTPD